MTETYVFRTYRHWIFNKSEAVACLYQSKLNVYGLVCIQEAHA